MITVKNLTYEYPEKIALKEVSFEIPENTITALVGPNGAGKTTLLRSIAAIAKPTSGEIYVNGFNVFTEPQNVHLQVGYLQDLFGLYDDLTAMQSLQFIAYSRLDTQNHNLDIDASIKLAISRTGIADFINSKLGKLSRGMRQKVGIAQAIIHNPKVLLLDEPASGLDPEARHKLSDLLIELKNTGMTIVVSSHILAELEDYSNNMLILEDSRIIDHGVVAEQENKNEIQIEVITESAVLDLVELKSIAGIISINQDNEKLVFRINNEILPKNNLLAELIKKNIVIKEFYETKYNLQDEYIKTINIHRSSK